MNVQAIKTGPLLQEYRESLMALGKDPHNLTLSRKCDQLEEEISRRMAW